MQGPFAALQNVVRTVVSTLPPRSSTYISCEHLAAVAKGDDGGYGEAAAIRRADNRRRRRSGGGMAPSSEWRCVALFFNNTTAPTHAAAAAFAYADDLSADGLLQAGLGAGGSPQGIPVPAAVNSLAWSSLEERLFTADTVGFVKASSIADRIHRLPMLLETLQVKIQPTHTSGASRGRAGRLFYPSHGCSIVLRWTHDNRWVRL